MNERIQPAQVLAEYPQKEIRLTGQSPGGEIRLIFLLAIGVPGHLFARAEAALHKGNVGGF